MSGLIALGAPHALLAVEDPEPQGAVASGRNIEGAGANDALEAARNHCACDAREQLSGLASAIRTETSVDRARNLATRPTALAGRALSLAARFSPVGREELSHASERLRSYHARVAAAPTGAAVAHEFESMFVHPHPALHPPGVHADVDVDVDGGGCDYSGGEIIATVLGFILGIIPGIILLILLC